MVALKKVSNGFLGFALLYVLLIVITPAILDVMDIYAAFRIKILHIGLGSIINNSREMSGSPTIFGLLFSGLLGSILNILFYFAIAKRHY